MNRIKNHPLVVTLVNLKGNARGCVFTEPMWGIPNNLYAPYASIYMLALGLTDAQVGLITTIGLVGQIIFSLLSGAITDKFGRKLTTLISDLFSWSIPMLILAVSQNFTYFVIAAIVNSGWRLSANSWTCLLVEDTDPNLLMDIFSMMYISGQLAVFFAPIASVLINAFTLVPTMRGLYLFAFVMMTAKFLIMNNMVTETRQGKIRMEETRGQSIFSLLHEYRGVFKQILGTPATLFTMGIMLVTSIFFTVNGAFWSILVTEKIKIPPQDIALYPFIKSIIMLIFFFFIIPRISEKHYKYPVLFGFVGFIVSQLVLILVPEKNFILLLVSVIIEAGCVAVVSPQIDRLFVLTVDPKERSRIMAIIYMIVLLLTSPFGWIGGMLSSMNRIFPFIMNIGLFLMGLVLVYFAARASQKAKELEEGI